MTVLKFHDWERKRHWVVFQDLERKWTPLSAGRKPLKIAAIETIQWYRRDNPGLLQTRGAMKADKLEITGLVRMTNGQEMGFDRISIREGDDLMRELTEKVAHITRECAGRGIPVFRTGEKERT